MLRDGDGSDDPAIATFAQALADWDFTGIELRPPTTLFDDRLDLDLDGIARPADLRRTGAHRRRRDRAPAGAARRLHRRRALPAAARRSAGREPTTTGSRRSTHRRARARGGRARSRPALRRRGAAGDEGVSRVRARASRRAFFDAGLTVLEAAKRIDLGPYAGWTEPERIVFNVDRAYRELRGEPCDAPIDVAAMFHGMYALREAMRTRKSACTSAWRRSSRTRTTQRPTARSTRNELRLADLAEPLGFDSIWGVEHHFTDYTMCPDVLQFLTYMAGRTQHVQLGSMVVVLPWHDPMRVAEQVSMLDHMTDGPLDPRHRPRARSRRVRRLPRADGRVARALRRERRDDPARARDRLLRVRRQVRQAAAARDPPDAVQDVPRPHLRRGRLARVDADHGRARHRHPHHPAEAVGDGRPRSSPTTATLYREVNGAEPPPPICAGWTFCDEDAGRAREMAVRYIGGYWETVLAPLRVGGRPLRARRRATSTTPACRTIARERAAPTRSTEFFLDLQVWGTPEQCIETILDIRGARRLRDLRRRVQLRRHADRTRPSGTCVCSRATVMPELKRDGVSRPGPRPAVPAAS